MRQADALSAWVTPLRTAALEAGAAILAVRRQAAEATTYKADASPVTEADRAAHRCLSRALAALTPGWPVVSEEDEASFVHRTGPGPYWLLDPLDGTKEFISGAADFTVNIALVERGRSRLGVVHAPALGQTYWGGPGLGAWREEAGQAQAIAVAQPQPGMPCRVVASKSHLDPRTEALIARLGEVSLLQAGSSLKFCRVAEGLADIYPRLAPTCEWDTAAAQAVLEGAGGQVVDLNGQALRYGKAEVLNPFFIATRSLSLIPA